MNRSSTTTLRHDWEKQEALKLLERPLMDLLFEAQTVHRQHFNPNAIQPCELLSIKTGACPEDCKYCSQSGHYKTTVEKEKLWDVDAVVEKAKAAKAKGADRFCMGAGWRSPREKDFPEVIDMVKQVKSLGMETCMTLGMLSEDQAGRLAEAGLDYYNHNLDTSPENYANIVTTRTFQDRLDTLENVRKSGMNVCCGGIIGMNETREDRASLLVQLANLPEHPASVPINLLIPMKGTPLENTASLDLFEWIRMIAVARLMMPASFVRLSAGRTALTDEAQAMCFFAGANSIFLGDKLLTADNPDVTADEALLAKLGLKLTSHLTCKEPAAA